MTGNEDTYEVFGTPNCGKGEPNQVEELDMLLRCVNLIKFKYLEEHNEKEIFKKFAHKCLVL